MKKYTLQVVINEGNDEFWDKLIDDSASGCDQIVESVTNAIDNGAGTMGLDFKVKLVKFEDTDE